MFKKKLTAFAAALLMLAFATPALHAEFLSVSAGIPVQHTLNDGTETDSVSGAMFHVKLPILVGLGYEMYETKLKDSDGLTGSKLSTSMLDVFYMLPIPFINVTGGVGIGTVEMTCDLDFGFDTNSTCADFFEKGAASQFYVQLGIPIAAVFDAHLSYHSINATLKGKSATLDIPGVGSIDIPAEDADVSSKLLAVGVSFGF